jgi:hypothetical protein
VGWGPLTKRAMRSIKEHSPSQLTKKKWPRTEGLMDRLRFPLYIDCVQSDVDQ